MGEQPKKKSIGYYISDSDRSDTTKCKIDIETKKEELVIEEEMKQMPKEERQRRAREIMNEARTENKKLQYAGDTEENEI